MLGLAACALFHGWWCCRGVGGWYIELLNLSVLACDLKRRFETCGAIPVWFFVQWCNVVQLANVEMKLQAKDLFVGYSIYFHFLCLSCNE